MKSKLVIIVSAIAVLELFLLIFCYFYVSSRYPYVFYKKPMVLVIDINGEIVSTQFGGILDKRGKQRTVVTSARDVVRMLDHFEIDSNIRAFILEIDSNGGESAGQEEIVRKIQRMDKPVVSVIRDSALSAGYFVAAGTDRVFASKQSNVGDIGLVTTYINRQRNGTYQECQLSSANFKLLYLDNLCPDFEDENLLKLQHYIEVSHELLVYDIAEMRNLSIDHVRKLSDGSIYKGGEAIKSGLVDEIGDTEDAEKYLENQLGTELDVLYLREMLPS